MGSQRKGMTSGGARERKGEMEALRGVGEYKRVVR